MPISQRNTPDSASPALVAIWGAGRALELACVAFVLLMFPKADVRLSYSGSSGSMVSKRGADELIVVRLGNARGHSSLGCVSRVRRRPRQSTWHRDLDCSDETRPRSESGVRVRRRRPQPAPVLRTAWLPNMSLLDRPNAHLCLPVPVAQPPRAPSAMLPSTPVYLM